MGGKEIKLRAMNSSESKRKPTSKPIRWLKAAALFFPLRRQSGAFTLAATGTRLLRLERLARLASRSTITAPPRPATPSHAPPSPAKPNQAQPSPARRRRPGRARPRGNCPTRCEMRAGNGGLGCKMPPSDARLPGKPCSNGTRPCPALPARCVCEDTSANICHCRARAFGPSAMLPAPAPPRSAPRATRRDETGTAPEMGLQPSLRLQPLQRCSSVTELSAKARLGCDSPATEYVNERVQQGRIYLYLGLGPGRKAYLTRCYGMGLHTPKVGGSALVTHTRRPSVHPRTPDRRGAAVHRYYRRGPSARCGRRYPRYQRYPITRRAASTAAAPRSARVESKERQAAAAVPWRCPPRCGATDKPSLTPAPPRPT